MLNDSKNKIQSFLKFFDLFSYSSFIRIKGESQFKTATGGFFSIAVLIIFAVLFTNLGIKTIERQIINWSFENNNSPQPTLTTVKLNPKSFMFAITIMGINLNNPNKRFFDVVLRERQVTVGFVEVGSKAINLVACTQQHFSATQQLKDAYNKVPGRVKWLCPQIGSQFSVFGKFTSSRMKFLELDVKKCDPALDITRPCATQAQIDFMQANFGPFFLGMFYVNPLINPGKGNYLDYYLQDKNYMAFSSKLGVMSNIYLEDYTITTDESILPFAVPNQQTGVTIPNPFQYISYQVTSNDYAILYIFKACTSTEYSRAFYKIDEFFSYIGGLVGVILAGMFLLASYNQFTFEHDLAFHLYKKDPLIPDSNLWSFFKLSVFSLLKCSLPKGRWVRMEKSEELREEMGKQLDLSLLLSRLIFLERSLLKFFEHGQFEAMHLSRKLTLEQARRMRQHLNLRSRLKKQTEKPSITNTDALNNTEFGVKEESADFAKQPSQEDEEFDSEDSVDSDLERHAKKAIKVFKNSLVQGNKRSFQIYKEVEPNYFYSSDQNRQNNEGVPNQQSLEIVQPIKQDIATLKIRRNYRIGQDSFSQENFDQFQPITI